MNAVDRGELAEEYNREPFADYNVAPSRFMPVAYANEDGKRIIDFMNWNYTAPFWPGGDKFGTSINARDDKIASSNFWKHSFKKRRCIIPAKGFYEWTGKQGKKTPHYIYQTDQPFMTFAGVYSDYLSDKTNGENHMLLLQPAQMKR